MSEPSPSCRYVLDSLSEYIDGTLQDALCEEIERHLAECENCRVVVDTLKKTVYLVHFLDDDTSALPDDVRARLFRKLNLEAYLKNGESVLP